MRTRITTGARALEYTLQVRGVVTVPDVIPHDMLPDLHKEFDRILSDAEGRAGSRSPLAQSQTFRDLAASSNVRQLVESILVPTAFIARSLLFDKRPEANWDVTWHRDTTIAVRERLDVPGYGPWSIKSGVHHVRPPARVLDHMLTVRLHLDECDESNGALLVVPGSHAANSLDLATPIDAADCGARSITCPVPAGGALLMRPLILHASKKATDTTRRRRVLHLEFAVEPLDGGLQWAPA